MNTNQKQTLLSDKGGYVVMEPSTQGNVRLAAVGHNSSTLSPRFIWCRDHARIISTAHQMMETLNATEIN